MSRKIAIYARVSTEHEEQLSALENQVQYYNEILVRHPDWEVYDRYVDEGITGTSTLKRDEFLRMMRDARDGQFDLIITREVSRFARNTLDTLHETRNLKKIGVEVWFIEDNIWTLNDEDGELRLTIMATLAQNESKKTSMRVKAGQLISFKNGVPYGNGNILGYDKLPNHGGYVINSEQAKTVRMIYDMYLAGMGLIKIKYALEQEGRKTATGLTRWEPANISRVLKNSFYCGIVTYRKEYTPDYLEQKKIKNKGEVEQIIVKGKHEPIVTEEEYNQVMQKFNELAAEREKNNGSWGKTPKSLWSEKLICGSCGCGFRRRKYHVNAEGITQYAYQCACSIKSGSYKTRLNKGLSTEGICEVPLIPQWKLEVVASHIFENLLKDKADEIISLAEKAIVDSLCDSDNTVNVNKEIKKLDAKIERIKVKIDRLITLRLDDEISKEEFLSGRKSFDDDIKRIQSRIDQLKSVEINEKGFTVEDKIKSIKKNLNEASKYDGDIISDEFIQKFVGSIVVYKDSFVWNMNFLEDSDILACVSGKKKSEVITIVSISPLERSSSILEKATRFTGINRVKMIRDGIEFMYAPTPLIETEITKSFVRSFLFKHPVYRKANKGAEMRIQVTI